MRISLYSGLGCWLIAPADLEPIEAINLFGPLQFEGTVPSHFIPEDVWAQLLLQCEAYAYARVSEELGVALLDQTLSRYGTLMIAP